MASENNSLADMPGRLGDLADLLGVSLAQWSNRETAVDKAAARRAATTAVQAIDDMLRELHCGRQQLVGEVRARDDAALAEADALLARCRESR